MDPRDLLDHIEERLGWSPPDEVLTRETPRDNRVRIQPWHMGIVRR